MAVYFGSRINKMNFRNEPVVRIKGLAIGIDIRDEKYAQTIKEKSLKSNLIINADDTFITIFPVLNIDRETAKLGLDILESCVSTEEGKKFRAIST